MGFARVFPAQEKLFPPVLRVVDVVWEPVARGLMADEDALVCGVDAFCVSYPPVQVIRGLFVVAPPVGGEFCFVDLCATVAGF